MSLLLVIGLITPDLHLSRPQLVQIHPQPHIFTQYPSCGFPYSLPQSDNELLARRSGLASHVHVIYLSHLLFSALILTSLKEVCYIYRC
jgi:hypothetical protein